MMTVSRLAVAAAAAITLAAVACTAAPDEPASVDVQTDTVTPSCIKGGITCTPTVRGGFTGGTSGLVNATLADPTPPPPPPSSPPALPGKGEAPLDCGIACTWDAEHFGCDCKGAGYGIESTIHCGWSNPCPRMVNGSYRCYPSIYCL